MNVYKKFYLKSFKLFPLKVYRLFSKKFLKTSFDLNQLTTYSQTHFKEIEDHNAIFLKTKGSSELTKTIERRRSIRKYSNEKVSKETFSKIVNDSIGSIQNNRKENLNYPSAGGLYPLEFYFAIFNVEDIPPGVYHLNQRNQSLSIIRESSYSKELQNYLQQNGNISNSSFALIITSTPHIVAAKYGNKSLKFIHFEIGHVTQNFMLSAVDNNLASVAIGGFDDNLMDEILYLDGFYETSEYACLFGVAEE